MPLLSWLKEREPEYAKRMAADVPEDDLAVAVEAMQAAADEPVPEIPLLAPTDHADGDRDAAKRERRRQRRKARPHGRAR